MGRACTLLATLKLAVEQISKTTLTFQVRICILKFTTGICKGIIQEIIISSGVLIFFAQVSLFILIQVPNLPVFVEREDQYLTKTD